MTPGGLSVGVSLVHPRQENLKLAPVNRAGPGRTRACGSYRRDRLEPPATTDGIHTCARGM